MSIKTLLKLGAAVVVGAAVFVGSTMIDKKSECTNSGNEENSECNHEKGNSGGTWKSGSDGLRDVQGTMMKVSQFVTTMITVFDAIGRLFSIDSMPRGTGSTVIF